MNHTATVELKTPTLHSSAASKRQLRPGVAYIMSRFPKLTETFVLNEMTAMEELGVRVEIYPLLRERPNVIHPGAMKWMQRAHFHPFLSFRILRAQWHFIRHRPRNYWKAWLEVLLGTWGSLRFFIGALAVFPKAVRFAYEMQAEDIAHIHAHFATHPTVAALIIHRLTGIPFSFTAHGSDLHVDQRMLDRKVEASAFAVTVSAYNRQVMVRKSGDPGGEKIHIVHCGVDPEIFTRARGTKRGVPIQILCVASFEEVKGHEYLVEACRILRYRGMDFRCHLVGDGPLHPKVETQIAYSNLDDRIQVHKGRPRQEIARMMLDADVFALASVPTKCGKREGIPVALMEAMASGVPVVASALSGIPELVESGRTGLLVPPRDPVALADAIQTLGQDSELRTRMGQAGREKVLREFNLRTTTKQLLQLFVDKNPRLKDGSPRALADSEPS